MFQMFLNYIREIKSSDENWKIAKALQKTEYKNESVYNVYEALKGNDLRSLQKQW